VRLITQLVVDYFASRTLIVNYFACAAHSGASAAPLVVDYSAYIARPGASARHAARHPARRRLLRLAQARHRLLRLRRASGCLGTSRSSSCGSSSTTSTTPCVQVPRHVARLVTGLIAPLVVDYSAEGSDGD
jgi:hypothetical protein